MFPASGSLPLHIPSWSQTLTWPSAAPEANMGRIGGDLGHLQIKRETSGGKGRRTLPLELLLPREPELSSVSLPGVVPAWVPHWW